MFKNYEYIGIPVYNFYCGLEYIDLIIIIHVYINSI